MALPMVEEVLPLGNDTINDTSTSNFSGPYSSNFIVFLCITYTVIFVLGLLGNISTCIVIWCNSSLHNGTNFYIIHLSISALLVLTFSIPLQIFIYLFSFLVGKLDTMAGILVEAFSNASVLTITAFTFERYYVISHPFTHQNSKASRVVKTIIAIWIIAMVPAMPRLMQLIHSDEKKKLVVVSEVISLVIFLGSMISLIILSVLIIQMMKTLPSSYPVDGSAANKKFQLRRDAYRRTAIKILVTVTLTFFLCWAPLRLQKLIPIYEKNLEQPDDTSHKVYIVLTPLSSVLYYLFTAINPFLYSIMSKDFRDAFKDMLPSWCRRRDRHRLEVTDIELLERRPLTTSQLCEPRTQSLNLSNLTVENEESNSGHCRQQLVGESNSLSLRQSI